MMTEENDILLKQLVKWYIKQTVNLFELNKSSRSEISFTDEITDISFNITYYILVLHILRSNKNLKDFELIKKTKNKTIKFSQFFKKHIKALKHFGYKVPGRDLFIDIDLILELDNLLSSFQPISPIIINSFYEYKLSIRFRSKNKRLIYSFENSHRKEQGIFYTPQVLAGSIVQNVLKEVMDNKTKKDFSCKILDPSCGCGIFLYECYDQLLKSPLFSIQKKSSKSEDQFTLFSQAVNVSKNTFQDKQNLLLNSIYGIDLDPAAVKITKTILLLRMMQDEKDFCLTKKIGLSLDKNFAAGCFFDEPSSGKTSYKNKKISGLIETDKIRKILLKDFDIIIGNPPWITYRKSEIGNKRWDFLRERYKSVSLFKMNTFPIFVEHSIEMMGKGSVVVFITPQRILDTPSYSGLRKTVIQDKLLSRIDNLSDKFFDDVIADTVILYLNKTEKDFFEINQLHENFIVSEPEKIPYPEIISPEYKINIQSQNNIKPLIRKIDCQSSALKKYFHIHVGMMIKNKKLQYTTPEKGTAIITSKCFSKFSPIEPKFVNLKESLIFGGTKDPVKQTAHPKIIVRKTGKEIVSTIDFHGNYTEQSCYILLPKENFDLLFLCAFLNSDLVKFYFFNNLMTNPASFPYIQHYDLEKIPVFKFGNDSNKKRIINSIRILSSKLFSLHGKFSNKPAEIKRNTQFDHLSDKINTLIYSLYDLSEDEIELIVNYLRENI